MHVRSVWHDRIPDSMVSEVIVRHSSELTRTIETTPCSLVYSDRILANKLNSLSSNIRLANGPPPFGKFVTTRLSCSC